MARRGPRPESGWIVGRDPIRATFLSQKLSVRDVATGNELFAIDDNVGEVDWSPSGEYLAVGSRGSVSIYDRSGHEVVSLPGGGAGRFGPRPHRHVR